MIHVSNIGEIIDIQCKKDVKKSRVILLFVWWGKGNKASPPTPPRRGRGVVSRRNGGRYFRVNWGW